MATRAGEVEIARLLEMSDPPPHLLTNLACITPLATPPLLPSFECACADGRKDTGGG